MQPIESGYESTILVAIGGRILMYWAQIADENLL
jgi:hypothetical protein